MATDLAKLVVKLEAQTAQYQKKLEQANKKTKKFEKNTQRSLGKISNSFKTVLGAVAIGAFVRKVSQATKIQEQAVKQLEQGLASTGNVVGQSLGELTKKAADLQKATTFGDEDIISAQAKLVTFTGIVEDQFDRTIEAALDLSTRMDQDLKSSVVQLGKALNDPVANLSALSRTGIQFTKQQNEMIRTLVKSNRLMDAQDIILNELERQFGGSAKAARDTFGGALDSLGNAFDDLFESSSKSKEATESIEELIALLQDPNTVDGINKLTASVITAIGKLTKFATTTAGLFAFLGDSLAAVVHGAEVGDLVRLEDQLESLAIVAERSKAQILSRDSNANLLSSDFTYAQTLRDIEATKEKIRLSKELLITENTKASGGNSSGVVSPKTTPLIDTEGIKAAADALKLQEAQLKAFQSTMESLRTPMEVFSDQQAIAESLLQAGKISQQDYNNALTHYGQLLNESTGANDQWNKDLEDAASFALSAKTELENLNEELARAQELSGKGLLSDEALKRTTERITKQKEELSTATTAMSEFGIEAARNIQDSFADFLFDPFSDGLDGMLDSFGKTIQRMIAEAASAQIMEALGIENLLSGGASGGSGFIQQGMDLFGGFFADGGRPPPGKVSVVGEQGPELFIPDGVSGSIIPNGAGGGDTFNFGGMVFPGVRTEKEAKVASGAAARQINQLVDRGGRYL